MHVADILADPEYARPEAVAAGRRTVLGVPLLREGAVIGTIGLARQRVEPFTERQIELVRTFADQAVIAIENARLLGELQARTRDLEESLEYQTATSDVLQVISQSAGDLPPVLETLLETAIRLCGVDWGNVCASRRVLPLGDGLRRRRALSRNPAECRHTAGQGLAGWAGRPYRENRIHPRWHDRPRLRAKAELELVGCHTMLGVPLLRDGVVIGVICMGKHALEAVTDKQIELVEPSPIRRLSRSRTHGCSANCRHAPTS